MHSLVIIKNCNKDFPLIIAANRYEVDAVDRGNFEVEVLNKEPLILGEKNKKNNGIWLGVNQSSLFASILAESPERLVERPYELIMPDLLKLKSIREMTEFLMVSKFHNKYPQFNLVFGNQQEILLFQCREKLSYITEIQPGVNHISSGMNACHVSKKTQFIHDSLYMISDGMSWLESYKQLKQTIASGNFRQKLTKNNAANKMTGNGVVSSSILSFSSDGLARYKFFDRSILRKKHKEGEIFVPKYKDYIDLWKGSKIENGEEEHGDHHDDDEEVPNYNQQDKYGLTYSTITASTTTPIWTDVSTGVGYINQVYKKSFNF